MITIFNLIFFDLVSGRVRGLPARRFYSHLSTERHHSLRPHSAHLGLRAVQT